MPDSLESYYLTSSGYLNSGFSGDDELAWDSVPANNAVINIPDAPAFTFSSGSGNDEPCSFFVHKAYMRDATKFRIMSKYSEPGSREWALFVTGTDKLQMAFYDSLDRQLAVQSDSTLTSLENQEISICGTYDGSNTFGGIKLYIDGLLISSSDVSSGTYTGMDDNSSIVRIGRLDGFDSMDGQLRAVYVIPVELSAAQVLTFHNTGSNPVSEVAAYTLNGNANDSSGNGHDGTNVNGTFVAPL